MGTLGVVARPSQVQSTYNQSELLEDLKSFDSLREVPHFLIANFPKALESQNRRQSPVPINKQTNTPDKRCSVLELNFVEMKSSDPALSHLGYCPYSIDQLFE